MCIHDTFFCSASMFRVSYPRYTMIEKSPFIHFVRQENVACKVFPRKQTWKPVEYANCDVKTTLVTGVGC